MVTHEGGRSLRGHRAPRQATRWQVTPHRPWRHAKAKLQAQFRGIPLLAPFHVRASHDGNQNDGQDRFDGDGKRTLTSSDTVPTHAPYSVRVLFVEDDAG